MASAENEPDGDIEALRDALQSTLGVGSNSNSAVVLDKEDDDHKIDDSNNTNHVQQEAPGVMDDVTLTALESDESKSSHETENKHRDNVPNDVGRSESGCAPNSEPSASSSNETVLTSGTSSSSLEEEAGYTPPLEDPYDKAWKYLSKNNILELFQDITENIAYKKPDDPLDFMIEKIEKLQEQDRQRRGVVSRTMPSTRQSTAASRHSAPPPNTN